MYMLDSFCQFRTITVLSFFDFTLTVVPKQTINSVTICPLVHIIVFVFYYGDSCTFWLYNLCSTDAVTSHGFCLIVATDLQHVT